MEIGIRALTFMPLIDISIQVRTHKAWQDNASIVIMTCGHIQISLTTFSGLPTIN